jgi:membrane protein
MNRGDFVKIVKSAFRKWQDNNATLRAAALAFFMILPLPSLLLFTVEIYTQVYGQTQGIQQLIQQIGTIAGPTIAALVSTLLESAMNPFTSFFSTVLSIIFTLAGAVGAFLVLQDTLNIIWEVTLPKKPTLSMRVRERIIPFFLVFGAAVVVVAWIAFTTLLFGPISNGLSPLIGQLAASILLGAIQIVLSFGTSTLLFGVIFKEIPDTKIEWKDVLLAAAITGFVFTLLNNLIGLYIRAFPVTSAAGAAGAIIILLLWIFVLNQFLLWGAQFSKCYAETLGSHAKKEHETEQSKANALTVQPQAKEEKKEQKMVLAEKPPKIEIERPKEQPPTPTQTQVKVEEEEPPRMSLYEEVKKEQREQEERKQEEEEAKKESGTEIIFEVGKNKKPKEKKKPKHEL